MTDNSWLRRLLFDAKWAKNLCILSKSTLSQGKSLTKNQKMFSFFDIDKQMSWSQISTFRHAIVIYIYWFSFEKAFECLNFRFSLFLSQSGQVLLHGPLFSVLTSLIFINFVSVLNVCFFLAYLDLITFNSLPWSLNMHSFKFPPNLNIHSNIKNNVPAIYNIHYLNTI